MRLLPALASAPSVSRTTWARASGNPILSPSVAWESTAVEEPTVLYESGTWKMWYTGGWTSSAMGYATCTTDPTVAGNWTKYASNPVLGQGTVVAGYVSGNNVVKVGSTYYAYYYDTNGGGNLKVSTSSDGITWGTPSTALSSGAVAWITGWANCFVWNEGGSTWKMLVEGRSTATGTPWVIAYATSTDGLSWTISGTGPLSTLAFPGYDSSGNSSYSGPWLVNSGAKVNGYYQLWYHVNYVTGSLSTSDIVHAYSTDAQTWTVVKNIELSHNGGTYEKEQAADPSIVEQGGKTYMFYDGIYNGGPAGYINIATIPTSIADLVLWDY